MKKTIIFAAFLLSFILAYAIPVPHGVSGYVYELDGITQVPRGTFFLVNDTASGSFVSGKTGFGSNPGKYVVALNGNDGDLVAVTAWNSLHSSSVNITLTGVMANINLLLNTTIPAPPNITSSPIAVAVEDLQYIYIINASDPDNDILSFSLSEYPSGMSISGDTITWLPLQSNIGLNNVKVRVDDGTFSSYQNFTVEVSNVNDIPSIISVPVPSIAQNSLYEYSVIAYDEDGDSLAYTLALSPDGMNLSVNKISWIPGNDDVGNNTVIVNVSDNYSFTTQRFIIKVENVNDAPLITSSPLLNGTEDIPYLYNVSAVDIDNDVLNYSLAVSPASMLMNRTVITWIPDNDNVGYNNITLEVSDGNASAFQSFLVYVANTNDPPNITSDPPPNAFLGSTYSYIAEAIDIDNDTLSFSLSVFPEGMAINNLSGLVEWRPLGSQIGENHVKVIASDGLSEAVQSFTITVKAPSRGISNSGSPGISFSPAPAPVLESSFFSIPGSDEIEELIMGKKPENAVISALKERPEGTGPIGKRVYKYFRIEVTGAGDAEIIFRVSKEWLERGKVDKENIVLNRFANDWEQLPTSVVEERSSDVLYRAKTQGFSYFAISVKNELPVAEINKEQQPEIISSPFSSFIVAGQVFEPNGRQSPEGLMINITNLNTSGLFTGSTGIGPYSGGFFIIVDGKIGDELAFKVEGSRGSKKISVRGDMKDVSIVRRANVLEVNVPGITGFTVFGAPGEIVVRPLAGLIILVLIVLIYVIGRAK